MLLQMLLLMIRLLRATWNITVNTVMKIIFVVSIMEMVLMVVKIPRRTHNVRMTAQLYDIIHKVWIPLLSHRSRQAEKRPSSGGRLVIWLFKVWKWCWLEKKSSEINGQEFSFVCAYNLSYNDHGKTLQLFTLKLTQYKQISLEQFRPERNFWWTRKWRFKMCIEMNSTSIIEFYETNLT